MNNCKRGKEAYICANCLVVSARADDVDICRVDIGAYLTFLPSARVIKKRKGKYRKGFKTYVRTRANQRRNILALLCTSHTVEVLEIDICDGQIAGVLVAQSQIALSVALGQFDSPVHVCHGHRVVSHILDASGTTATLQAGF